MLDLLSQLPSRSPKGKGLLKNAKVFGCTAYSTSLQVQGANYQALLPKFTLGQVFPFTGRLPLECKQQLKCRVCERQPIATVPRHEMSQQHALTQDHSGNPTISEEVGTILISLSCF